MDITFIINIVIVCVITSIFIYISKHICLISKIIKEKNKQLIQENIKLKNELTQYQQIKHNNYHTQSLK